MSTAPPPSDGDRPTEGESAATPAAPKAARPASRASGGTGAARTSSRASTAKTDATTSSGAAKPAARTTRTAKPAAGTKTPAAGTAPADGTAAPAAKKPATRTRRTTAKPTPIAPEGEAPSIMDATLGARNPVATSPASESGESDTSSSPAEPLAESESAPGPETEATTKRLPTAEEVYAAPAPTTATARVSDTSQETAVDMTEAADTASTVGEPSATDATPTPVAPTASDSATAPTERLDAADTADTEADTAVPAAAPGADTAGSVPGPDAHAATSEPTDAAAGPHAPSGRTVHDLADRLDDSRFFSSLFDFTFTNYVTRKLAGPVYVVGLVLIALGVVVGFANALTSAIATHAPIGAFVFLFGVLITLVGAMLAVLLLRVGIEVFCAIIEIAQNTRRRRPPGE
ncbi:DUF4282 domain-containing protein [Leifsonia sp. C5G2]|uniref:DUF4282 domain-containing protein n=1 Tax=Leifsonia sp. C5G2 TaxID=2735269 RepID=UPI00158482F9|nr:DUF4282 domain-containing protein [Leifsonia sp. C5G2]NUU05344.1 DUF4282 domain-containing protein [Leifsonia sp. C5G2]